MVHYGLGLEYRKAGEIEKAAGAFAVAVRAQPELTAAFQELGTVLVALGRREEARHVLADGAAAADRTGAWRAREHIARLLSELEASTPPESATFCEPADARDADGEPGPAGA